MLKSRNTLYILLFLVLLLLLWMGLSLLPGPVAVQLPDADGGYDLIGWDFEDTVYVTAPCWESWPEKLYTPEDLAAAEAPVPHQSLDYTTTQYATHRLRLTLPPDVTYGISIWTSDYAMRLYIDGKEIDSVGVPAATREETIPRVMDVVYYFVPRDETAEFVVQASNFVHKEGGWAPVLTVGTAENIAHRERVANLKSGLIFGCLMTACLYHLAMFLMNRRRLSTSLFSACCLLLAFISGETILLLFPGYNWYAAIKIEYTVHYLTFAAVVALVKTLFPGALHKWIFKSYLAFCGLFLAVTLLTDSTFFSQILIYFEAVTVAVTAYGLIRLAMTLRDKNPKNFLAFLGIALVCLSGVNDILYRNGFALFGSAAGQTFTVTIGMIIFVFCYAMVLSIEEAEADQRLDEISRSEMEMQETNLMLERLDRLRVHFLANITHEIKTPLTVIDGFAQYTLSQIKEGTVSGETNENLSLISAEANRLSELAGGLLRVSADMAWERRVVSIAAMIERAEATCRYILAKNSNRLEIQTEDGMPPVRVNGDMIHQVLLNLIFNANKHTQNGVITILGTAKDGMASVTVSDNGKGIPPELLPQVFQWRVSGGGGYGLGLAICKEIIDLHNGNIAIESMPGEGTRVTFTLPPEKEEADEADHTDD